MLGAMSERENAMILVTGATGLNGRLTVQALRALGAPVRAMVRDPAKAANLAALGAAVVAGDFESRASLQGAIEGCERAFLLVAVGPTMFEQEATFVAAARRTRLGHVVKLSTVGADLNSKGHFTRVHGMSEKLINASTIPYTHLRANFFMQNMLRTADTIKREGKFYSHHKDGKAADVDARDIAAVAARVLTDPIGTHDCRSYAVTGPQAQTSAERAAVMSRALGRKIESVSIPREAAKKSLLDSGMPDWLAQGVIDLDEIVFNGEAGKVSDTVQTIGRKPPISFEQFVRDNAAAFTP